MVITLSGCLTILAFKISKKLNFDLKIGILKMLSKNSVSSTLTATLEIWWYLIHKMTNFKKWKKRFLGLKFGSGSKLNLKLFLNYKFNFAWKSWSLRPIFEQNRVTWKKCPLPQKGQLYITKWFFKNLVHKI